MAAVATTRVKEDYKKLSIALLIKQGRRVFFFLVISMSYFFLGLLAPANNKKRKKEFTNVFHRSRSRLWLTLTLNVYAAAVFGMGWSVKTHSLPLLYTAMHLLPTRHVAVAMGVGSYRYKSGYAACKASVASSVQCHRFFF